MGKWKQCIAVRQGLGVLALLLHGCSACYVQLFCGITIERGARITPAVFCHLARAGGIGARRVAEQ